MDLFKKVDGCYELTEPNKMFTKTIKIQAGITLEVLENIIVTALEGGIGYWAGLDNSGEEWKSKPKGMPISQYAVGFLVAGSSLTLYDTESEDKKKWFLTLDKIIEAVYLHYTNSDLEDIDSEMADNIIQYALFGEIIYG